MKCRASGGGRKKARNQREMARMARSSGGRHALFRRPQSACGIRFDPLSPHVDHPLTSRKQRKREKKIQDRFQWRPPTFSISICFRLILLHTHLAADEVKPWTVCFPNVTPFALALRSETKKRIHSVFLFLEPQSFPFSVTSLLPTDTHRHRHTQARLRRL
jgi:hypothetical protein